MSRSKKLIVTADDFGLTPGINRAIATAYREGIVTTASLMVNGSDVASAVQIAKQNPGLDVGLHLNLTEGRALSDPTDVPSLADSQGFLYDHPVQLATALFLGKVHDADLKTEIRAQIEKGLALGLPITHIDGHKHVHVIPQVLQATFRIMPDYGIRGIRSIFERTPRFGSLILKNKQSWPQIIKQYALGKGVSGAFLVARRGSALIAPTRFYGITQTGFLDLPAFAAILEDLNGGVGEVMCHPGYVDDLLKRMPTRLLYQRERELEWLTGPEVRDMVQESQVSLMSYRDLMEAYGNPD